MSGKLPDTAGWQPALPLAAPPYSVDPAAPTYYIKRVLRPSCLVALCLAALTPAFGQVRPISKSPKVEIHPPTNSNTNSTREIAQVNPEQPAPEESRPPAPAPMTTPFSKGPGTPDSTVVLQYPNSDVADVLHLYETLTGKKLVMDNFVQGKVNIFISKPVPRDEAIRIIEINLLMNGYSLVPAEGDIVKVIGTGRNPRGTGVPIISDEADIPSGDHVVSFLFKLRYADPVELQQVLGQYLSPPATYTSFLALPKASAILVTENSSVIRTLAHIIEQVDIPPAEVVSEFIKLTRADATKVVDMLKDVFEKGNQPAQPGVNPAAGVRPVVRAPAPITPPQLTVEGVDIGALYALTEDSIVVGKIKISADVRTNRIHVITRPINMPFIRKLIAEFDANVEFAKPVTRPLRYISAAEVLPVIVQALTEPGTTNQPGAETAGTNPNAQQQNQQRRTTSTANTSTGLQSSSSSSTDNNVSEELSTQSVDTTPKAVTVGNAKIIADQRANTIIVLGNREVVVKVGKILDEMDVKAPQVALSTVIGELTLSKNEDFGIDYFSRFTNNPGVSGVGTTSNGPNIIPVPVAGGSTLVPTSSPPQFTGGSILDPSNLLSFTQIAQNAASGTNVYLAAGNTLAAVVHMLNSTGHFRTISRPTVFTSNNKKAIIASGQEVPVPVNSLSNVNNTINGVAQNTGLQTNIEFKKITLQLEVVPLINSEKEVSLDILQKVDSIAGTTTFNGNPVPTIQTRYIRTTVSAPNCSTIVLGGLIQEDMTRNQSGIPILSRIPIVGALFRNTQKEKTRRELIVLMRPEVSLTNLDLYRLRLKSEDKTHFGPGLDNDDCPDCPKPTEGKELQLPAPDLPVGSN
jgi:type II secretion system protein D